VAGRLSVTVGAEGRWQQGTSALGWLAKGGLWLRGMFHGHRWCLRGSRVPFPRAGVCVCVCVCVCLVTPYGSAMLGKACCSHIWKIKLRDMRAEALHVCCRFWQGVELGSRDCSKGGSFWHTRSLLSRRTAYGGQKTCTVLACGRWLMLVCWVLEKSCVNEAAGV
jgi:hypothetical protein